MFFSNEEIEKFRQDTPGCIQKIHLNNAGAGLMPTPVTQAIKDHIDLEASIGGYEAADLKAREVAKFYVSAGKLLGCSSRNIAFTANATDSFSRAISSILFKNGDVILTSNEDYISNQITYLSFAKRFGTKLVRVASLPTGGVDLDDFEFCVKKHNPRLVAITHIPTNSGLIQPVEEIGKICRDNNIYYLVDACQSVGQLPLRVDNIQCDFLSVTSRKFLRGPRGAGFLYISDRVLNEGLEPLFIDMRGADWVEKDVYVPRDDAKRFEDWEFAYALLLGTGAAIDYMLEIDAQKIEQQIKYLSDYIRTGLLQLHGVTIHDKGAELGGLVTFHLKNSDANQLKKYLLEKGINAVTSIRNFAVIDYDEKQIDWTIRVSPHYYNTIEEADKFLRAINDYAKIKI